MEFQNGNSLDFFGGLVFWLFFGGWIFGHPSSLSQRVLVIVYKMLLLRYCSKYDLSDGISNAKERIYLQMDGWFVPDKKTDLPGRIIG